MRKSLFQWLLNHTDSNTVLALPGCGLDGRARFSTVLFLVVTAHVGGDGRIIAMSNRLLNKIRRLRCSHDAVGLTKIVVQ